MKKLLKKIKSKKGESFVEILVAVLVIAFAIMMVATMYTSAFQMNVSAKERDDAFFKAIQKVESMEEKTSGTVTLKDGDETVDLTVDAYVENEATAFRKAEESDSGSGGN